MIKNEKAVLPLRAATQEVTALHHPDKDEVILDHNNSLSVVKNQQGSLGDSAASQRSRILTHLQKFNSLTTLQGLRELDILRLAARIKELRNAGYPILTCWTNDVTSEGHSHRVAKYVLLKSKQLSLFDWLELGEVA